MWCTVFTRTFLLVMIVFWSKGGYKIPLVDRCMMAPILLLQLDVHSNGVVSRMVRAIGCRCTHRTAIGWWAKPRLVYCEFVCLSYAGHRHSPPLSVGHDAKSDWQLISTIAVIYLIKYWPNVQQGHSIALAIHWTIRLPCTTSFNCQRTLRDCRNFWN